MPPQDWQLSFNAAVLGLSAGVFEEVARYLSLHELTVRRLAREGEIPAFKIGRQWRVKKALLDRWIEREAMRNVHQE